MAEGNARECVLSKALFHKVLALNVSVDSDGTKPLTLNISVKVVSSPLTKNLDVAKLAEDATEMAFTPVAGYLREFSCKSTR